MSYIPEFEIFRSPQTVCIVSQILYIFLTFLCITSHTDSSDCDENWNSYPDNCYVFVRVLRLRMIEYVWKKNKIFIFRNVTTFLIPFEP